MHMRGFVGKIGPFGDPGEAHNCVILLFHSWTLDSVAAFVCAVVGTFAIAIFTEGLSCLRREHLSTSPWLRQRPLTFRLGLSALFTCQVTLGYCLMLIAMTYQLELFLAVMLGLGAGHLIFNVKAPVGESTDACCVDAVVVTGNGVGVGNTGAGSNQSAQDGAPAASGAASGAACPLCVSEPKTAARPSPTDTSNSSE